MDFQLKTWIITMTKNLNTKIKDLTLLITIIWYIMENMHFFQILKFIKPKNL
jgi:hypothetical protein